MGSDALDYVIRPYEDADQAQVLTLLTDTMAGGPTGQRTAAFFRWKHAQNPFGPSVAMVAEADGKVVGFRTFMRWEFVSGAGRVRAVRAVDTATHPRHQGRGIFTRLTRAALDRLRDDTDLVFNTPNSRSLPGYLKMGWEAAGEVPIAIRPVHWVRFALGARRATGGTASGSPPDCPFPPLADVLDALPIESLLAQTAQPRDRLTTPRTMAYLKWRYTNAPDLDYRGIAITAGSELRGLAIGRPRRRGPLAEFTLSEALAPSGDRATVRKLLRAATRSGCDHVATHLSPIASMAQIGRSAGYLQPRGQSMTLAVNPLTGVCPDPRRLTSWHLSMGDLEVF